MNKKRIQQIKLLIAAFFAVGFLSLPGTTLAQTARVTVDLKQVSLKQAMHEIEKQTNYLFIYDEGLDLNRSVNVEAKDKTLGEVLTGLFSDMPVSYTVNGTNIVLSTRQQAPKAADNKPVSVQGVVRDSKGQPVIGAAVLVKGTTIGTSTDVNGAYALQVPPPHGIGGVNYQLFGLPNGRGARRQPHADRLHAPGGVAAG